MFFSDQTTEIIHKMRVNKLMLAILYQIDVQCIAFNNFIGQRIKFLGKT